MAVRLDERAVLAALMLAAAGMACAGLTWGLPSRDIDVFLFGDRPPWSGEQILRLAGDRPYDPHRGADVDRDPLSRRSEAVRLNETDEQRAKIILRYRLYTYQPDEMSTMMSLASMQPGEGDFDPKLYQYGGLWVYPVGVLLKLASMCGLIALRPDVAYYLDDPEAFGSFYVVARLYVVAWTLVGVWAVFRISRRLACGCVRSAAAAAVCMIVMPVVVNMSHEAKPHLPAAVLMLLAIDAAMRYVETGRPSWWIGASCLCGAAFGMVLSALPIFVTLPVMAALRRRSWRDVLVKTVLGGLIGGAVYLLTNPYVLVNAVINRAVLRSNLSNSLAMYEIARLREGFLNAGALVWEGASLAVLLCGSVGAAIFLIRVVRGRGASPPEEPPTPGAAPEQLGWLLATPVALILLQFVALAAGKPGEYGRFAVLPDVALAIAAVLALRACLRKPAVHVAGLLILVISAAVPGVIYLQGFVRDSRPATSRRALAEMLRSIQVSSGARTLGVFAEPAPYALPPVNLFDWDILLLPAGGDGLGGGPVADVLVQAVDAPESPAPAWMSAYTAHSVGPVWAPAEISWADKPFRVLVRKGLHSPPAEGVSDGVD